MRMNKGRKEKGKRESVLKKVKKFQNAHNWNLGVVGKSMKQSI